MSSIVSRIRTKKNSKTFNLIADRIAHSRATVETEQFGPSTPPGNDTNATFHKHSSSVEGKI